MKCIRPFLIFLLFLIHTTLSAQPSFSPSTDNGCGPLFVTFTNYSHNFMDTTNVSFRWELMGGVDTMGYHMTYTFTQPGNYQVRLRADSAGFDRGYFERDINVYGSQGMFMSSPMGSACPGEKINFYYDWQYDNLEWNFGDGSTDQNNWRDHVYSDTGIYMVTLALNTQCGNDTITQPIHITTSALPEASMNINQNQVCPNDILQFGHQNNNNAMSFLWTFGDGTTSTQKETSHAYASIGIKTVILRTTNLCGNESFDTTTVDVNNSTQANAGFWFWPDKPCPNDEISFDLQGTGSFAWDFGDGNNATIRNPKHVYPDTGLRTVRLIVTNSCGSVDTNYRTIDVRTNPSNKPNAYIKFRNMNDTIDTLTVCPGANIEFQNNSWFNGSSVSSLWDFGDGMTSQDYEPKHTFNTNGVNQVNYIATNTCMGRDTASLWVVVDSTALPNVDLQILPDSLCPGETVYFFDDNEREGGGIVYDVLFGDGQSAMNLTARQDSGVPVLTQHMYPNVGNYIISFTATNPCGNSVTLLDTIAVVGANPNQFYYISNSTVSEDENRDGSGCPGDTVGFFALGGVSAIWHFGDGSSAVGEMQSHVYPDTGTYNAFAVMTTGCGAVDTVFSTVTIKTNNSPYANFDVEQSCAGTPVKFRQNNGGGDGFMEYTNETYVWDFGDGNSSTDKEPQHIYATSGSYNVNLTVTNGCGSESEQRSIFVDSPASASFTGLGASYCVSDAPVSLIGTPGGGVFSGPGINATSFDIGNAGPGNHIIKYTYTNSGGCSAVDSQAVSISPLPMANAGPDAFLCSGGNAQLNATGGTGYVWSPATGLSNPNIPNPVASPAVPTQYIVQVTQNGCDASDTIMVNVAPSLTANAGPDIDICLGGSKALNASGGGSYSWSPTTGLSNSSIPNPVANPTVPTLYTLTVSSGTCSDTQSVMVHVHPLPNVTLSPLGKACIGSNVTLTGGSPAGGTYIGPGVSAGVFNPTVAGQGTHMITYKFTSPQGCTNSATATIEVNTPPVASFPPQPSICIGSNATLTGGMPAGGAYSGPGVSGTTFNSNTAGVGTHLINYSFTDANGCTGTATTTITVLALPVANLPAFASVCEDGPKVPLTTGSPFGGTYSGPGVSNTGGNWSFDPKVSGLGTHTITYSFTSAGGCSDATTASITVNPLPAVTQGPIGIVCIGSSGFTLTGGSPAGGTYSGPGVSSGTFDPNVAGVGSHLITYSFTNGNGCTQTATTTINVNAQPNVTLLPYADVCIDAGNVDIASGMPVGGTLSGPGVTGTTFNTTTAGVGTHTITYTYTDAGGCSGTANANLTVHPLPVVSLASQPDVCLYYSPFTIVGGSPAGGTYSGPGVNAGTFNPKVAGAGTHTISYKFTSASGCTDSATKTITVVPTPMGTAGADVGFCTGTSAQIGGTDMGHTYSWSPATGLSSVSVSNPTATPAVQTTYIVTITNSGGCAIYDTVVVTPTTSLTADAGTDVDMCQGQGATLAGLGGGAYQWTPATGLSNPNIANPIANPSTNTTYTLTVSSGTCSDTSSVTVVVHPMATADAGANASICEGQTVQLAGLGIGTLSWSPATGLDNPNIGNPMASPSATTTYYLTSTLGICSITDSMVVTVNPNPTADAGSDTAICPGGTVMLAGSGSGTIAWTPSASLSNPGIANPVASPSITTNYILTVTSGGCSMIDTVVVTVHDSAAAVLVQSGDSLVASAAVSYQWYKDNTLLPGETAQFYMPSVGGNYTVEVTDANGCTGVSNAVSYTVDARSHKLPVGIIKVYPNPNHGEFRLNMNGLEADEATVAITDLNGRSIYSKTYTLVGGQLMDTISMEGKAKGIYLLKVSAADKTYMQKIVLQ